MINSKIVIVAGLAALLLVGCRDKEQEELARRQIETAIAQRESRIAHIKREAAKRFEDKIAKVPQFDRDTARKRLVQEKLKMDLDKLDLKTRDEVRKILEDRTLAATDQRYPPSARARLVEQAAEDYPLYKVGQEVAVSTKIGRGATGQIEAIDDDYVKIGRTKLLISDIVKPDPACFNKELCDKQRRFVVHVNYDAPRRDELERQRARLLPTTFREFGYLYHEGAWRRVDELFASEIDPLLEKEEKAYWEEAEKKVRRDVETDLLAEGLLPFPDPIVNPFETEKKD